MDKAGRYPLFDWLRLFLASEVVVFHCLRDAYPGAAIMVVPAVPAFLGLSGFVVLQSWERSYNAWHFWWKRILRIQPAMTVMLLAVLVLFGTRYAVDTLRTYISLGALGHTGNGVVWTLSCEEVAYLTMAFLAFVGAYRKPAVIASLLAVCSVVALRIDYSVDFRAGVDTHDMLIQNFAELGCAFFIGNLAYLFRRRALALSRHRWLWLLSALYPLTWLTVGYGHPLNTLAGMISIGSIIVWGLGGKAPTLTFDLSYGTYLWHIPVLRFVSAVHRKLIPGSGKIGWFVMALGGSYAVAAASWFLMERYCLRLKDVFVRSARSRKADTPVS